MSKKIAFLMILCLISINTTAEAKKFKTPYQVKKSAYFKNPSQAGYFQSTEAAWYEKPFVWTANGLKAVGSAVTDLVQS